MLGKTLWISLGRYHNHFIARKMNALQVKKICNDHYKGKTKWRDEN